MVLMKIAIAGTNGLAQLLAHEIESSSTSQFVFLSRRPVEGLAKKGWQVIVVDYRDQRALQFKLAGTDVVLSTVCGDAQVALMEAAAAAGVKRFVPSEFSGNPSRRPTTELIDKGHRRAIVRLATLEATGMRFCTFTCGVFYERFGPGGLAQVQIAKGSGIDAEGCYLLNIRRCTAKLPPSRGQDGSSVKVSMVSLRDLARSIVAALKLKTWPREFKVRGDRLTMSELVEAAATMRGKSPWTILELSLTGCLQVGASMFRNCLGPH
jgi:nucleoside-diphosphate-sugar epimerase